ncbi:hypothetical protein [Nocardia sp. NPDC052316]|uniref:hypothetical protein n=1 Tax=Nocardia sp. NPDC052316 TaxID=3364329 RepID=UPI0037CCBE1D
MVHEFLLRSPFMKYVFPVRSGIRVRQADLGRDGAVSTVGMARWLEDARIRLEFPQFEQLVAAGEFGPYQIIFVGQSVERLAPVRRTDADIEVHTDIRRIGRSSFTYGHAVFARGNQVGAGDATVVLLGVAGPLALPEELVADLTALARPDSDDTVATRPDAERHRRSHYAYFAPLRARISDVDLNQHVNYLALAAWYDEAVAAFTTSALDLGGLVPDLSPSSYRIDYVGEVTYPGDYDIGVLVGSFDADVVHYQLGIFLGDTCLGVADAIGPRGELRARSSGPC